MPMDASCSCTHRSFIFIIDFLLLFCYDGDGYSFFCRLQSATLPAAFLYLASGSPALDVHTHPAQVRGPEIFM